MNTPILFLIFNRPDLTRQVFSLIRQAKPKQLFVVADGPRSNRPGEAMLCEEARSAVIHNIDWACSIKTLFSDVNMGCGRRVSSGISWVFTLVDQAIILEDDCLPSPTFFPYCSEMLSRYADDPRVMNIAGFSHRPIPDLKESYYFTKAVSCWGWATWKRAWNLYDFRMKEWEAFRNSNEWAYFGEYSPSLKKNFEDGWANEIDTWDYQWVFTCIKNGGLSISPKVSLIRNTGCRADGTHTLTESRFGSQPSEDLSFPLKHPDRVFPVKKLTLEYLAAQLEIPSKLGRAERAMNRIRRLYNWILRA